MIYIPCELQAIVYSKIDLMINELGYYLSSSALTIIIFISWIVNLIIFLGIMVFNTFHNQKNYKTSYKSIIAVCLLLYIEFMIYEYPSIYLFVNTAKHNVMLRRIPEMPSYIASLYITVQIFVVMIITQTLIKHRKNDE